jgi:ribosomal protein L9
VTQAVEYLICKHKALNSNPSPIKERKKERRKERRKEGRKEGRKERKKERKGNVYLK